MTTEFIDNQLCHPYVVKAVDPKGSMFASNTRQRYMALGPGAIPLMQLILGNSAL